MTTIDVIVPSRRAALVPRILRMLAQQERVPDAVTIVSNVPFEAPGADVPWRRLGFRSEVYAIGDGDVSLRRNIGLVESECDVVLFMDDDELPPANFVISALQAVERDGIVWGNYRYLDVDDFSDAALLLSMPSLGRARETPNQRHTYKSCYGGCMAVWRKTAMYIGGFDLAYTSGGEDQHFAVKIAEHSGAKWPWQQSVLISEPPFVWHRTTPVAYDVEPHGNMCGGQQGHFFVWDEFAMRCRSCPLVVVRDARGEPRRVHTYNPARMKHVGVDACRGAP